MNKIMKDALILMAITLVAGICLGFVYDITKEPIAAGEKKAQQEAYQAVFPGMEKMVPVYEGDEDCAQVKEESEKVLAAADLSTCKIEQAFLAVDADGNYLGVVMNITTSGGYGGDINFSMGIQKGGTLNAIEILSISETAGLGMRATEDTFKQQFDGKPAKPLTLTKSGNAGEEEVDALSGATITSTAMTAGVNAGICYYNSLLEGGALDE